MYPQNVPMASICWDSWEEAVTYHKEILDEYPIGKGMINNPNGPTFATVVVNLKKPSWTYIHFHHNVETGEQIVCAMASGTVWDVIVPEDKEKIEI